MPRRNQGPRLRWLAKRGCYYITWTEGGRSRERSTGTTDSKQAQIIYEEWLHARRRRVGPSDPPDILVTDLLDDYLKERGPEVVAKNRIVYAARALIGFWQGNVLADVTKNTCRRYVKERGCSVGTARRELGTLLAAINHAFENGRITRPVAVELPGIPPPRDRWLTRTQVAHGLREACKSRQARLHLPLHILIGLYTGRRDEAIRSLRWPQVDLKAETIDFERPGRERTNKRRGRIPIPWRLLPHLKRARRRGTDLGYVIHIDGKRVGNLRNSFKAAFKRAGIEGITPHVLRHTCATWLMQRGTDLWEAAGFLGMSVQTLQRVYGHHHPDHQRKAADNISRRPSQPVRAMSAL
jgi:integrase